MNVHRIRLRGPWHYEWLGDPMPDPKTGRVTLPNDWREIFGEIAGRVKFQRTFHCPTNLAESSRVDLVFEGLGGEVKIVLNGQTLRAANDENPLRIAVTEFLRPTNDLQVEIHFEPNKTPKPGGLWGLVVLEILE